MCWTSWPQQNGDASSRGDFQKYTFSLQCPEPCSLATEIARREDGSKHAPRKTSSSRLVKNGPALLSLRLKNGLLRFYFDIHSLNAVKVRASYPMPTMNESIDTLEEAGIFLTFDAPSEYCEIEIYKHDW